MAHYITHSTEYSGLDSLEIVIRPAENDLSVQGLTVITTEGSGNVKIPHWKPLDKILKAYSDGFQGGSASTKKDVKYEVEEFKAEAQYSKQDYMDTVYERIINNDASKQNNIEDTDVYAAEQQLFSESVMRDIPRIWWMGDKNKKHTTAGDYHDGTSYTYGDGDGNYNVINGIWTQIMTDAVAYSSATVDDIRRVTMSNGAVAQVTTVTLTGTSGTANITFKGKTYLATFDTNLTTTAANFVTAYEDELALRNCTVTSSTADVIFTSSIAGVSLGTISIANVTTNLAGSVAATTANTAAQDLATDEALSTFQSMVKNSTRQLRQIPAMQKRLYVTTSMLENYRETIENDGTEAGRIELIDGREVLKYRGIEIIETALDDIIADDFEGAYPHRALLTTPANMAMIMSTGNGFAETRYWFNPDQNVNRQRTQFEFGAGYRFAELMTAAY